MGAKRKICLNENEGFGSRSHQKTILFIVRILVLVKAGNKIVNKGCDDFSVILQTKSLL